MTEFITLRLSTDHVNGRLYQAVRHPGSPGSVVVVSSTRECFEATWEGLQIGGVLSAGRLSGGNQGGVETGHTPNTLHLVSRFSLGVIVR